MSIDPLNIDSLKVPHSDQSEPSVSTSGSAAAGTKRSTADVVYLSDVRGPRHLDFLKKNDDYTSAAAAIREKDRHLDDIGQKIGALKEPLTAIAKQFPPYGVQDQARVRLMKEYVGLRKEIDALTVPRPHDGAASVEFPALPAPLSSGATDSQINDHLKDLDTAGASYAEMRRQLASEADAMTQDGQIFRVFSTTSPDTLTESAAVQKSAEIGQQFAGDMAQGVTTSNSQFLKSLG